MSTKYYLLYNFGAQPILTVNFESIDGNQNYEIRSELIKNILIKLIRNMCYISKQGQINIPMIKFIKEVIF